MLAPRKKLTMSEAASRDAVGMRIVQERPLVIHTIKIFLKQLTCFIEVDVRKRLVITQQDGAGDVVREICKVYATFKSQINKISGKINSTNNINL